MSDRPTEYSYAHNPLRVLVETGRDTGAYKLDPRLAVDKLVLGSNETESFAMLRMFAGAMDVTEATEDRIEAADVLFAQPRPGWDMFISPEQRVLIVRYPQEEGEDPELFFAGYCTLPRYDERGGSGGMAPNSERDFTLKITSMWDRVATLTSGLIVGRWMRTAAGQDALDAAQDRTSADAIGDAHDDVRIVPSLPCVFNAGGKPNRATAPVTDDTIGEGELVHAFTHDGDPDAQFWTYAQALRYLIMFHLLPANPLSGEDPLLLDGNAIDLTADLLTLGVLDRPVHPPDQAEIWDYAMLGEPRSMSVESLNICEALQLLASAAKVRYTLTYTWAGTGYPDIEVSLLWRGRGTGTAKTIAKNVSLEWSEGAPPTADDVTAACQIKDLSAQIDYRDVYTWPRLVGAVRRYEITQELVPGWAPDSNLDDVADADDSTDFATAHLDLTTPEDMAADDWFERYHKSGINFQSYAQVGRRWVLNETGFYRAADYARTGGAFQAAAYAPWGPEDCSIDDTILDTDGSVTTLTVDDAWWTRRARPFQPCFSADELKRSLGIYVEFSFDSGTSWWHLAEARIANLTEEAGIYLDDEDLVLLVRKGDDGDDSISFWEAMVRGYARVRVTAVIDGDQRLEVPTPWTDLGGVMESATGRVIDVSDRFVCNRRDGGNSIFAIGGSKAAPGVVIDARDDLQPLASASAAMAELLAMRQIPVALVIPWITRDYDVLDTLTEIEGTGIVLRLHGADRAADAMRPVDIVAIEYAGAYTRIMLDDDRMIDQVEF